MAEGRRVRRKARSANWLTNSISIYSSTGVKIAIIVSYFIYYEITLSAISFLSLLYFFSYANS